MKHNTKRTATLFLALLVLATALLGGCSSVSQKKLLTYKKQSTSDAIFTYLCCMEKTNYLYEIYGKDKEETAASSLTDSPSIWLMEDENGASLGDTLKDGVMSKLKVMLYLAQYAVDGGYTLTDTDKAQIKAELDDLVSNYGDKKTFNKGVAPYGINYNILHEYYLLQGLASIGNYLLFGEGGKMEVSDETAKAFFEKSYVTAQLIYVNTVNKLYPNGKTVYLPDSEKEQKIALAGEILSRAQGGEDFAALYKAYSEKQTEEAASSGNTFAKTGYGDSVLEDAVFAMKIGEIQSITTENGIYIVKKLPLNASYFTSESKAITEYLEKQQQEKILAENAADFLLNEEIYNSIDIGTLQHIT